MKLEMLIDELQEIVDSAFKMPFSGSKKVVNAERIQEIVEEMRTNMPQEVRQAKSIVADRNNIINKAKKEAEMVVQQAEERAKAMVERNEITRQAQQKATEIVAKAEEEATQVKQAANRYIEHIMKKADDDLSLNLAALKKTRQNLRTYQTKNESSGKSGGRTARTAKRDSNNEDGGDKQ